MQTSDQTTAPTNPPSPSPSPNLGLLASSRDQTAGPAASPDPPSTATAPDPEATPRNSQPATLNPTSVDPRTSNLITGRRRIGKVARLPKPARDKLNHMLEDGASYPDIIAALGPDGADLNEKNISRWKEGGYQDWVREQTWLAEIRALRETATDLTIDFDATQLNHAALQLASLQMFQALRALAAHTQRILASPPPGLPTPATECSQVSPSVASTPDAEPPHSPSDPGNADLGLPGTRRDMSPSVALTPATESSEAQSAPSVQPQSPALEPHGTCRQMSPNVAPFPQLLDTFLGGDSAAFVRLMNSLARISRETTLVQKHQDQAAKARAALKPMLDPNRKLTESENRAIVRKVSTLFGLDRELKPEEITFTYGRKLPGKEVEMFGVSKPLEGSNASTNSSAPASSPSTSNNNI